jgi:phenylpropionate dioxygenase-like ring-hydroxylating dioxygenase large terminal subunit
MSDPALSAPDYKALVRDDRIHASLYTDPRIFEDEMEQIFYRGWIFVGHDSEIPRTGDFITRSVGTQPIIMVRGKDGGVAVLVNRCMHRGTMVCAASRGRARTFSCPYHGWTYDLSGELLGVPYPGGYTAFDKSTRGLTRVPRVASYRGFVFASFSERGISLAEHLGAATKLIDRSCDLSPEGRIELSAGWVKHRCAANWKMLPENDSDGYHLGVVHLALFKTVRNAQYQRVVGDERAIKAVVRDWGNGHIEIDWSPGYQRPFEWFGGASGSAVDEYVSAMERRYGAEATQQRIMQGPAHALIFPNLFLGETNIAIVEPLSVEACVHWHTPMFLAGVPQFNRRLLRMAEAGMGPASFLMPEDLTVAARNQVGLHARNAEWLELSRGLDREHVDADGRRVSHVTGRDDEPRALEALPDGDDGRVARPAHGPRRPRDGLRCRAPGRGRVPLPGGAARRRGPLRRVACALDRRRRVLGARERRSRRRSRHADLAHLRQPRPHRHAREAAPDRTPLQPGARLAHAPADLQHRGREGRGRALHRRVELHPRELSIQAKHEMHWWVGRTTHRLRLADGALR